VSKILINCLVYRPDTVSAANIFTDVAEWLANSGHEVTVITSVPHYSLPEGGQEKWEGRRGDRKLITISNENGVRILRVYMRRKGRHVLSRVLDYLWFHLASILLGVFAVGKCDVVFVPSPPITLGITGHAFKFIKQARLVYDVRELWPSVPIRLGLISNRLVVRFTYAIEKFVYKSSDTILAISRSFIRNIIEGGVPADKLVYIPVFIDTEFLKPKKKHNEFALEYNLTNKFVVFYAGNAGHTQELEILVEVAEKLSDIKELCVLIIGDGASWQALEKKVVASTEKNIMMLPFQNWERICNTYATADVCVSPMKAGFNYDTVPSKIYSALAAGCPVVVAAEKDTEAAMLVRESNSGIIVPPEDASAMAMAIRQLHSDPEKLADMGNLGREWVEKNNSRELVLKQYDRILSA